MKTLFNLKLLFNSRARSSTRIERLVPVFFFPTGSRSFGLGLKKKGETKRLRVRIPSGPFTPLKTVNLNQTSKSFKNSFFNLFFQEVLNHPRFVNKPVQTLFFSRVFNNHAPHSVFPKKSVSFKIQKLKPSFF